MEKIKNRRPEALFLFVFSDVLVFPGHLGFLVITVVPVFSILSGLAFLFVPVFRSCRLSGHCGHCVISLCLFVHNKINTVKWINWAEKERGLISGACIFSCRLCPFPPSLHGSFLLLHVISLLFLTNIVPSVRAAYPFNCRGFVGAIKKTSRDISVFNSSMSSKQDDGQIN